MSLLRLLKKLDGVDTRLRVNPSVVISAQQNEVVVSVNVGAVPIPTAWALLAACNDVRLLA
jgi:hypothetical protein